MAELVNRFAWSFSRAQTFDACKRRYWFRHYAHWGGWNDDAPELARRAYFFSKMTSLRMLLGTAVHETIADVVRARRSGRTPRSPFEQARSRMNDAWLASKQERWRTVGPKRAPPLWEHHYGIPVEPALFAELREQAERCLRNFLEGPLHLEIARAGPDAVRAVDKLEPTTIGGVDCFVAPDLVFDRGEELWLVDWKTGGEREEHDLQLRLYAEHARQKWGVPPERMRAFDVMLSSGRQVEARIDEAGLGAAAEAVRASAGRMLALLADRERNEARREDHPPTTDVRECRRCFFREICDEQPPDPAAGGA